MSVCVSVCVCSIKCGCDYFLIGKQYETKVEKNMVRIKYCIQTWLVLVIDKNVNITNLELSCRQLGDMQKQKQLSPIFSAAKYKNT